MILIALTLSTESPQNAVLKKQKGNIGHCQSDSYHRQGSEKSVVHYDVTGEFFFSDIVRVLFLSMKVRLRDSNN